MRIAKSVTVDSLETLRLTIHTDVEVDIFDVFRQEYMMFVNYVQYEFGILQVGYGDCKKNEYSDISTGFKCVCLENYQRKLNAPVCVLCDRLSSSCCRNSVECAMKKNA